MNINEAVELLDQNLTEALQSLSALQFEQAATSTEIQNLQDQVNTAQAEIFMLQVQLKVSEVLFNATLQELQNAQIQLLANQNLTEELGQLKAQVAVLTASFANIDEACLNEGRRLEQTIASPCLVAAPVGEPPVGAAVAIALGSVGGVLLLALVAFVVLRKGAKPHITRPQAVPGEISGEKSLHGKKSSGRSSTPMAPPPYPPPNNERGEHTQAGSSRISSLYEAFRQRFIRHDEQQRAPPIPPPRPYERPSPWWRISSPWILRTSHDDRRRKEELQEEKEESVSRDPTLPVFLQRPSDGDEDEEEFVKEAIL